MDTVGLRFATALAAKDVDAIRGLLAEDIDFKALTPRKFWEATDPDAVIDVLLGNWFQPDDHIDALVDVTEDAVEDTGRVGYRLAITTPDGPHTLEQQAYYRTDGDRIGYVRLVCSGYRPVG
jgi:hypothetical protein